MRTRVICVRVTEDKSEMVDELQQRWGTEDLSATLREAISVAYETGWRRCCVCKKGLGVVLGTTIGPSDGYCPEHYAEAMREAEEWIPPAPKAGE